MERLQLISKVIDPIDWVLSLVYNNKSHCKIRICLNPKDLNNAIKHPHCKTHTPEKNHPQILRGKNIYKAWYKV